MFDALGNVKRVRSLIYLKPWIVCLAQSSFSLHPAAIIQTQFPLIFWDACMVCPMQSSISAILHFGI